MKKLKEVLMGLRELWEDWDETRSEMSSGVRYAGPYRNLSFILSV